jgi:hypothetical protein
MGTLRDGLPDRLDGRRLPGRDGEFRSGGQRPAAGLCSSSAALGLVRELGFCEELVHDLGAYGDDGS